MTVFAVMNHDPRKVDRGGRNNMNLQVLNSEKWNRMPIGLQNMIYFGQSVPTVDNCCEDGRCFL